MDFDYKYKDNTYAFNDIMKQVCKDQAEFVIEKNEAYGNSVVASQRIMRILYPHGVRVDQYNNALYVIRILDKLMRISTAEDAFGESPWKDIMGYSLLAYVNTLKEVTVEKTEVDTCPSLETAQESLFSLFQEAYYPRASKK